MSKLAYVLNDLLRQAARTPGQDAPDAHLAKGLHLSARQESAGPVLILFRDHLTPPAQEEAVTCGEQLRWYGPVIRYAQRPDGMPCLTVQEARRPASGFCPGLPMAELPARLPLGRLCGLAVGDDWVTVLQPRPGDYLWRTIAGPHHGEGSLSALREFLAALRAEGKAA